MEDIRETWLPENLVIEILLRLPVKNLLMFKCVCKDWYKLVKSHYFTTSYNTDLINKKKVPLYCKSYMNISGKYPTTAISFRLFDIPLELTIPTFVEHFTFVGCSYGLVCFSTNSAQNEYVVWNPATTSYRLISNKSLTMWPSAPSRHSDYLCTGFCLDPMANTFKLARVHFTPTFIRGFTPGVQVDMFRSSSGSWTRKRVDFPCEFYKRGKVIGMISVARYIYWSIEFFDRPRGISEDYILCFDMVDEVFTQIDFPSEDCYKFFSSLTRYKESLAVLVLKGTLCSKYFDVWVMNDCGGIDRSWSKLSISRPIGNHRDPLGFLSKDEVDWVLMHGFPKHSMYNPDTGEIKEFSGVDYQPNIFLYHESLASVY